jgi:hypothetical protein
MRDWLPSECHRFSFSDLIILAVDTKHVPCKFFRQGACQAGPACPFLHSTDAAVDYAPCKYFTKVSFSGSLRCLASGVLLTMSRSLQGNCKFGAKCALAHILPDGRRVNRPNPSLGLAGHQLNLGGRVNPQAYVNNQGSALTNSVLSQQRMNGHDPRFASQLPPQEEFAALHAQQSHPPYDAIPSIDTGLVSDGGSKYGSPADDTRLPMSPNNHLSALDAPLPASFDSQGISHAARYGPVAASVPSKFGMELSPPANRAGAAPDALRNRRDVSYGSEARKQSSAIGSSPPAQPEDPMGPRFLRSQQRAVKPPRVLSASVPRPTALDDWEEGSFPMEEDFLPMNLHDDVLTPQERLRRLSRTDQDSNPSHRDLGLGMTSSSFSKVGSPLGSSPSRFGALFAKQRQKKEEDAQSSSAHVGSPLRESSLHSGTSPSMRPIGSRNISGDIPGSSRRSSTSMISQQLSGMSLHPGSARHSSTGPSSRLDRSVASPVNTSTIDEEQSDLVFSMEEEENNKRSSSSWSPNREGSNDEESTPTTFQS